MRMLIRQTLPLCCAVFVLLIRPAWLPGDVGLVRAADNVTEKDATKKDTGNPNQKRRRGLELFEKKIRPVLIQYCYECHSADSDDVGGNLLLDTRDGLLAGGESGAAIDSDKPAASLLIRAIEYRDMEMPPDQKLPDEVIADFRRWVNLGAPDPRTGKTKVQSSPAEVDPEPVDLWSVKPIGDTSVPNTNDPWSRTEIDRFIYAKYQAEGLRPSADADPASLIRRLYFDLVGLPPSPNEVLQFVEDPSPERYAAVVDSLLASQGYGERWGRHWLDVARYGESAGSSRDVLMIYAWRYRDYVINAFNHDLPFDQFVREQVAGDLMDASDESERERRLIATGLLAIGSKSLNGGNLTYDIIDDQIDVISKSLLGLTVSCARCHDHKFDPIPTADYYSLAGIFLSTETRYGGSTKRPNDAKSRGQVYLALGEVDPEEQEQREKAEKDYATLAKQVQASKRRVATLIKKCPEAYREDPTKSIGDELNNQQKTQVRQFQTAARILAERQENLAAAAEKRDAFEEPRYTLGVKEANKVSDANILVRGEKNQKGDVTPRGFLSAIEHLSAIAEEIGSQESGRRELAAWLTHPENPLTSRVAVNRIWQHLMGQGIVPTVDNFGVNGMPPSHPQLLDYLAKRFVGQLNWSQKSLIREIVMSRTYQLSSHHDAESYAKDPDNRLRWRMDRRRLEAEPLRDAILSVSGLLCVDPFEGSLVMQIGEGEVGRNINTSVLEEAFDYRSVYLPVIRGIVPEELKLFDFPEPSNVQGLRDSNTTSKQSLFFMNSPFVLRAAEHFAKDLLKDPAHETDRQRIETAYLRAFGRPATDQQVQRSLQFISTMKKGNKKQSTELDAWTTYCQSLLSSAPFRFID